MCGRYFFSGKSHDEKMNALMNMMGRKYGGQFKTGEIFPGDAAPAIIGQQGRIVPVPAVFGFPGVQENKLLINARSETAAERKTFAESFRNRRIILPATGFFEWGRDPGRTKYLFTIGGCPVFYLCGLYKIIEGRFRFVILTRAANASMIGTHDRMPVIVDETAVRPYLTDREAAGAYIASSAPELIREEAL